ncbi:MAG: peptide/nickel transport system substrate-binding protein [Gemmatimonadaceae bacterium]|jgi:oligopeptide transport system substrate-binding protein|nr:peptide/nickel transport system substrate-binding protein [Gemmatimonadaceae bacterium]
MRRLFLLVLPAIFACGGGGGESAPLRKTIIDSRDTYDPRSMDPALSTDVPTGRVVSYLFDGLTRITPEAKVVPGLAKAWDVSPDGITYTFHLHSGVKFHDGRPLTSKNVVASFQRVLDPATKGGRGWPLYPIKGAEDFAAGKATTVAGLAAPDDSTVVMTLKEPLAIFPKMLTMPVTSIVPENPSADFGQKPVGSGPWKFVEWRHDDYMRFAKNPDYFDGPPKTDSLMARIIPEMSTATAEFEAGNVDVLNVPDQTSKSMEADPAKKKLLTSTPALRFWYVAINVTRGPLKDPRVRQALNYAVDVNTMLAQVMAGRGAIANGVVPPVLDGYDANRKAYPHDVAKAKQLLTAAGFPNGIDVDLWASTTDQSPRISQTVQANLAEAGIRAKIIQRDASSMREAARKGQTDLALKEWWADYPDAENFLYPLLHSKNRGPGGNVSFYSNPKFDALVDQAHREQDEAKRNSLYTQADQLEFDQAPMIYLFFYKDLYAVQPWIKGFKVPAIFSGQRWTDVTISK